MRKSNTCRRRSKTTEKVSRIGTTCIDLYANVDVFLCHRRLIETKNTVFSVAGWKLRTASNSSLISILRRRTDGRRQANDDDPAGAVVGPSVAGACMNDDFDAPVSLGLLRRSRAGPTLPPGIAIVMS